MPTSEPSRMPLSGAGQGSGLSGMAGQSKPEEVTEAELAMMGSSGAGSEPKEQPPAALGTAAEGGVGTVWNGDKRIVGLWAMNQVRNSWIYVANVGWQKLANNSDSAIVALTMLAAHARELNRSVTYRTETDNMVHEMYVW